MALVRTTDRPRYQISLLDSTGVRQLSPALFREGEPTHFAERAVSVRPGRGVEIWVLLLARGEYLI